MLLGLLGAFFGFIHAILERAWSPQPVLKGKDKGEYGVPKVFAGATVNDPTSHTTNWQEGSPPPHNLGIYSIDRNGTLWQWGDAGKFFQSREETKPQVSAGSGAQHRSFKSKEVEM